MRIVSKFKDYYDCAGAQDRESLPIFIRKQNVFDYKELLNTKGGRKTYSNLLSPVLKIFKVMPTWSRATRGVITFCGVAYPYYYHADSFFFGLEELITFLKNKYKSDKYCYRSGDIKILESSTKSSTWKYDRRPPDLNRYSWELFQTSMSPLGVDKLSEIHDSLFMHFGSPIIQIKNTRRGLVITTNPRLNYMGFVSKVDPYTAYQEIDMFLGNNMANQKELDIHVTDELKIHYKGFDKKYGFRTRPKK